MKKISILFMVFITGWLSAQYTSPGNGTVFTLSSLSAAAPTVLVNNGTFYTMTDDITISATDKLLMNEDTTVKIASGKTLYIAGEYDTTATNLLITAVDSTTPFKGIRFEDGSTGTMKNTRIEYGGGIRVLTANFFMDNCIVYKNNGGISTSGAIGFSKGIPVVQNSQFLENERPAFGSAANATVSARLINNYLFKNVQNNANTPQINMGPGGTDSLKVINNTIIGDRTKIKAGGVSASALIGGTNYFRISGNTIKDNRYGITSAGASSTGIIQNNIIEDNNTENLPNSGGSGINILAATQIKIYDNTLRNNLWGVTIQSNGTIDMGTVARQGNNTFKDNANGGMLYALYNNTPQAQTAIGNCWREGELSTDAMVEEVIVDQLDNSSLGLVTYKPYKCASPLAVSEVSISKIRTYPNPNNGNFSLETPNSGNYLITDYSGKIVASGIAGKGKNSVSVKLPSGAYLLVFLSNGKKMTEKILIK